MHTDSTTTSDDLLSIKRHAWIFFSDLNSRFGTLIEEYGHLQETIFGFLPSDIDNCIAFGDALPTGLRRPKNPANYIDVLGQLYYKHDQQTKTLVALNEWLGSLIEGIEENRKQWTSAYTDITKTLRFCDDALSDGAIDKLYWFFSRRAHFLNTSFEFYTGQLEYAHEKLVQILETRPGNAPNPILFRRWNSAIYEDFLSSYARHARWESEHFINEVDTVANTGAPSAKTSHKDPAIRRPCVSHGWAHETTSTVTHHTPSSSKGETPYYGTIRSAYFYLEQPILFPLIYHEVAHLQIAGYDIQQDADLRRGNLGSKQANSFGKIRRDTHKRCVDHLSAKNVRSVSIEKATGILDEFWADAIAVRLCGIPYVVALAMQMFGHCGKFRFSSTRDIPLDEWGKNVRGSIEPHNEQDEYFWPARMAAAIQLARILYPNIDENAARSDFDWLVSLEGVLKLWWRGFKSSSKKILPDAYARDSFVREYENTELLDVWVTTVVGRPALDDIWTTPFEPLQTYMLRRGEECSDSPFKEIRKVIRSAAAAYISNLPFRTRTERNDFHSMMRLDRIESCLIESRWLVSSVIADTQSYISDFESKIETFATYVRHDGNAVFRIAMEWMLARDALYLSACPSVSGDLPPGINIDKATFDVVRHDDDQYRVLTQWVAFRKYDNDSYSLASMGSPLWQVQQAIDSYVAEKSIVAAKILGALIGGSDRREAPVGMIAFGTIRPAEFSSSSPDKTNCGYVRGTAKIAQYFSDQSKNAIKELEYVGRPLESVTSCLRWLVGDYSFMLVVEGITPTERSSHPHALPKMLTKTRFVYKVYDRATVDESVPIGRVSLLKFSHRSEWISLYEQLSAKKYRASLFLSSGWEDVILITWHPDLASARASYADLHIRPEHRHGIDIQSSFVLYEPHDSHCSDSRNAGIAMDEWANQAKAYLRTKDHLMLDTTGRYDYVIWWDHLKKDPTTLPLDIDRYQRELPCWFWEHVGNIATTYQWAEAVDDKQATSRFISRIVFSPGRSRSMVSQAPQSAMHHNCSPSEAPNSLACDKCPQS